MNRTLYFALNGCLLAVGTVWYYNVGGWLNISLNKEMTWHRSSPSRSIVTIVGGSFSLFEDWPISFQLFQCHRVIKWLVDIFGQTLNVLSYALCLINGTRPGWQSPGVPNVAWPRQLKASKMYQHRPSSREQLPVIRPGGTLLGKQLAWVIYTEFIIFVGSFGPK